MNNRIIVYFTLFLLIIGALFPQWIEAKSVRGHIITAGRNLSDAVAAPLKGIFILGPRRIKDAYQYEVHGREKKEKRGLLRYKLFALWRAPGEEVKGIIDGCVDSVHSLGEMTKSIISIFFSD